MLKNRMTVALCGIAAATLLAAVAFTTVHAQTGSNPVNAISSSLDQVLAILDQLNPQAGENPVVLSTPWLSTAAGETIQCPILNVGTTGLTDVSAEIYDSAGVNIGGFDFPNGLAPRAGTNAGAGVGASGGPVRCEFTFKGGPASSVRANLIIRTSAGSTVDSVDAR